VRVRVWRYLARRAATLVGALIPPVFVATVASVSAQPVLPPIEPPRPAVPRAANALVISSGDLNESVNWARQGNLADAAMSFKLFKDDWDAVDGEVREQSADIADQVDGAIARVDDVLGGPDAGPPDQSEYYPALQHLQQVVEDANIQLGVSAPATNALRINPTNLGQSVAWARQGNLARAHDEYAQFRDDWSLVRDAVRQQAPSAADMVETASAQVQGIVADPARPSADQSEYVPALQRLQQIVLDVNAQLATLPPPTASNPPPPVAPGPVRIRPGNLAESVEWAAQGNLASARSEFDEFQDNWASVSSAVRQKSPDIADQIEAAIARVQTILAASAPPKEQYFPALQDLQQVVLDANEKLGS
jgi:methyl-accepting chemotaxis protein